MYKSLKNSQTHASGVVIRVISNYFFIPLLLKYYSNKHKLYELSDMRRWREGKITSKVN